MNNLALRINLKLVSDALLKHIIILSILNIIANKYCEITGTYRLTSCRNNIVIGLNFHVI